MNKVKFKNQVKNILLESSLFSFPIKIESLTEHFGIKIVPKDMQKNISGLLISKKTGENFIIYNLNDNSNRIRFSIAHEIAHFFLHRKTADIFIDDKTSAFFRDKRSSTGELKKEREANSFAAELLMPTDLIKENVDFLIDINNENKIKELSKMFQVSKQAMTVRLHNLGYIF